MVVDAVSEVLRIDDGAIEPAKTVNHAGEYLQGIGKLEGRLLIILDLDKIFSEKEQAEMKAAG
jgi:purine-binding chemotaxis protein CheW